MTRAVRMLLVLLLPLLVIAGCGGGTHSATTPPASASAAADGALPADPSGSAADAAPIDEGCPTSNTIAFAKTKFLAHTGLAFGAFHRYLYKPFQAGTFKKGASGRITAFIKGGLAVLFVKREIRLASEDVKANPTLCKAIAAPWARSATPSKPRSTSSKPVTPAGSPVPTPSSPRSKEPQPRTATRSPKTTTRT
jgi:hypothetical protein